MELVQPSLQWKESFLEALKEFEESGISGFWNARGGVQDIESYIERTQNESRGVHIADDWVPSSTLWLVDGDRFIGHTNIRHKLNDYLQKHGGHIGFFIRPSEHAKGYGTKILELALQQAKRLGIEKVLVTCDKNNAGSRKVIEKNGGVLQDEIEFEGIPILRFWIEL